MTWRGEIIHNVTNYFKTIITGKDTSTHGDYDAENSNPVKDQQGFDFVYI